MFLDDIFKMKMTPKMMQDFIDFGYTSELTFSDDIFYGLIHRFAVFCDADTGNVTFKTIKNHVFKDDLAGFRNINSKILKDNQYKKYDVTSNGEPILNKDKIREAHYRL